MRYAAAWAVFSIGHVISLLIREYSWACRWLWTPYNRVMVLSDYIQGDGRGPWGDSE